MVSEACASDTELVCLPPQAASIMAAHEMSVNPFFIILPVFYHISAAKVQNNLEIPCSFCNFARKITDHYAT
jgi:hypothetical protein